MLPMRVLRILAITIAMAQTNASGATLKLASEVSCGSEGGTPVPAGVASGKAVAIVLTELTPDALESAAILKLWEFDTTGNRIRDVALGRIAREGKYPLPDLASAMTTMPGGDIMLLAKLDGIHESILRLTPQGQVLFRVTPPAGRLDDPMYTGIIPADGNDALVLGRKGHHAVALRIGFDGAVISTTEYDFDDYNILWDGVRFPDGTYGFAGRSWKQEGFHEWVAKVNAAGEVTARAEVTLTGLSAAGSHVAKLGDRIALVYPTVDDNHKGKAIIRVRMYNDKLEEISDHVASSDPMAHARFSIASVDQGIALVARDEKLNCWISMLDKDGNTIARTQYDGDPIIAPHVTSIGGKPVVLTRERCDSTAARLRAPVRLLTFALPTATQPGH
jgi:hypothetical protein